MPLFNPWSLQERNNRNPWVTFHKIAARHNPRGEALKEQGGVGARKPQDITAARG